MIVFLAESTRLCLRFVMLSTVPYFSTFLYIFISSTVRNVFFLILCRPTGKKSFLIRGLQCGFSKIGIIPSVSPDIFHLLFPMPDRLTCRSNISLFSSRLRLPSLIHDCHALQRTRDHPLLSTYTSPSRKNTSGHHPGFIIGSLTLILPPPPNYQLQPPSGPIITRLLR